MKKIKQTKLSKETRKNNLLNLQKSIENKTITDLIKPYHREYGAEVVVTCHEK